MRKILFAVLRITIGLGLMAYIIIYRINIRDEVTLTDGTVVRGILVGNPKALSDPVEMMRGFGEKVGIPFSEIMPFPDGKPKVRPGVITAFRHVNRGIVALGLFGIGGALILGAWRWLILLRTQRVNPGFGRAARLTLIGQFFNNFMLGLTGGDLVKAYLITRHTPLKTQAVTTVIMDRVVGMVVLAGIGAVLAVFVLGTRMWQALLVVYAMAAAMGIFILAVYSRRFRRLTGVDKIMKVLPFAKMLNELRAACDMYRKDRASLFYAGLISLASHSLTLVVNAAVGRALGIGEVGVFQFFALLPVILTISSLPITPGGWGFRESMYAVFFGLLGVPNTLAFALSVSYGLYLTAWGLIGGVFYIVGRTDRHPVAEMQRELDEVTGDTERAERL